VYISRQPQLPLGSYESQSYTEFNDTFCLRKYCLLFTHESSAFLSVMSPIEKSQKRRQKQPQWDAANSPKNCPFPFDDHHQNLIHPYRAGLHSPSQTASRSMAAYSSLLLQWLYCVIFELLHSCTFCVNPHLDLEPDYII